MRVLVADDESNVRYALRALMEEWSEFEVVAEVVDAERLLAQAKTACPNLVLLDWELPGLAADGMLPALRELCPNLWVIVLSGRPEARRVALAAGADAFVSKVDPPERLLAVINGIVAFILSFVLIGICTGIAGTIYMLYVGYKAYQGESINVPLVTDFIKGQGWA